jgi:hypothetical protein
VRTLRAAKRRHDLEDNYRVDDKLTREDKFLKNSFLRLRELRLSKELARHCFKRVEEVYTALLEYVFLIDRVEKRAKMTRVIQKNDTYSAREL